MKPTRTQTAKLHLILSMIIFGTVGLFVRAIPLPSSLIALVRGLVGALFLLMVTKLLHHPLSLPDIKRNLRTLCLAGVAIGANWILLFEAYRHTTVAIATLCYYLAPIFAILASPLLFGDRIRPGKALCVLTALIGMVLVSGVLQAGDPGAFHPTGVLFGLGAAVFYATVMLLNRSLNEIAAYDMTIVELGMAALVLLPYTLFTGDLAAMRWDLPTLLPLAVVSILHTGVTYTLYFGAMRHLPTQTSALLSYLDPIVAVLLSALLLREPMDALGMIGAVLVLGSTILSERLD